MRDATFARIWHYLKQNPGSSCTGIKFAVGVNETYAKTSMQSRPKQFKSKAGTKGLAWFAIGKEPEVKDEEPAEFVDPIERKQAVSKQARLVAEHSQLVDEVQRLRAIVEARNVLASTPLKPIVRREFKSGLREATAVVLASDWHVEEQVLPGSTPTPNVYNLRIAEYRIERFFAGIVWLVKMHRERFKIRDLVLWLGGDLMSGYIHEENVETSAMSPIATMLWLRPQLVSGIEFLLETLQLSRLVIPCSYGNHGRDTKKPRRATGAHHSYEWGMYQELAERFQKNKRVSVLADPSAHQYAQIYDFDTHWHHGDETNYQGGVGGITIPINKAVAAWDKVRRCHYHNFGHWHQYIDLGNWAGNGSLIGFNAYAMSIKASPERAQQGFYLLDSKRGKTCKSPLWVDDFEDERALW